MKTFDSNQIMHSEWSGPYLKDLAADRIKYTAKARGGLKKRVEYINSDDMLDIADYIISVATFIEEYFLEISSNNSIQPSDENNGIV